MVACYTYVISALRRLKQKNYEFQVSLGYIATLGLKMAAKVFSYHSTITNILNRICVD